ncbi:MAG TPA: hypothetical protein VGN80_06000 [Devosiaceae bacterium]|nr:hypothetical protein [Devosiaceae bacterium]
MSAFALDVLLRLERSRHPGSLARPAPALDLQPGPRPDLAIDLTGRAPHPGIPTLTIDFGGQCNLAAGLSQTLASAELPNLVARLDGVAVAHARPMIGDRLWLSRAASDLLAGAVSLIELCVHRFAAGMLVPLSGDVPHILQRSGRDVVLRYLPHLAMGLVQRRLRRSSRPFYWQVAWRQIEGPGVAETGRIDGRPFAVLPDDGRRFYADPFAFEWQGAQYLFVEEYEYGAGKGVISVARLDAGGTVETPRVVIAQPHHLSYPQVFARAGEVYMIPEASTAGELVLYRATSFPDRWVREAVLVEGRELNDMTLLERNGRLWLVGSERRGNGNASDTMVVYHASALTGPWLPHGMNPILVDRSAARPGGAFVERGGRVFLPVQDGTLAYGGGLGLAELLVLNEEDVRFGPVQPIASGEAWDRAGIHTLNRAGRLEVIDSAG